MRRIVLAGMAVLTVTALAGCSSGGGSSSSKAGAPESASSAAASAAGGSSLQRAGVGGNLADVPAARPAASGGGYAGAGSATTTLTSSAKIRTAVLTVEVKDGPSVTRQADAADVIAAKYGGEVDSDDRQGSGKEANATLVLRVQPASLENAIGELTKLGTVTARQQSARDVTGQVADVQSRVQSAQEAITRLRALYAQASKVSDVIAVENDLSSREADLESLQAQQRSLAGQTDLATVTLHLLVTEKKAAPAVKKKQDRSGFVGGLHNGWDAFTTAAAGVAKAAGAVLPFLVVLLILAAAARVLWRRSGAHLPGRPGSGTPATSEE